jgi:hypothetical protein
VTCLYFIYRKHSYPFFLRVVPHAETQVGVVDGPCKGQQGVVLAVLREKKRIVVEGVNMVSNKIYLCKRMC